MFNPLAHPVSSTFCVCIFVFIFFSYLFHPKLFYLTLALSNQNTAMLNFPQGFYNSSKTGSCQNIDNKSWERSVSSSSMQAVGICLSPSLDCSLLGLRQGQPQGSHRGEQSCTSSSPQHHTAKPRGV